MIADHTDLTGDHIHLISDHIVLIAAGIVPTISGIAPGKSIKRPIGGGSGGSFCHIDASADQTDAPNDQNVPSRDRIDAIG